MAHVNAQVCLYVRCSLGSILGLVVFCESRCFCICFVFVALLVPLDAFACSSGALLFVSHIRVVCVSALQCIDINPFAYLCGGNCWYSSAVRNHVSSSSLCLPDLLVALRIPADIWNLVRGMTLPVQKVLWIVYTCMRSSGIYRKGLHNVRISH